MAGRPALVSPEASRVYIPTLDQVSTFPLTQYTEHPRKRNLLPVEMNEPKKRFDRNLIADFHEVCYVMSVVGVLLHHMGDPVLSDHCR